ncbi:transglycosylase domain-containing protein [Georgenia thermotolerans]|uniref:PASTA domain-containing protein n=1 Tax=Georgenia thermotolerans TaxID=527326 RepID=A0A7J5UP48_9MICO|nr:transglycosylase domain-containing protein [Georgenia thermotolerans]KAE8763693.1 PASTA domain-containing protein [Georgenia thermotolerans]
MSPAPSPSGRAVKPKQLLIMLLTFVLVAGLGGVVAAGLVMPAAGAVGAVTTASTQLFDDLPSELAIPEPSEQSVILAADGTPIATFFAENRIVVGLDKVSTPMQHAVVAVEDRRFYQHRGIDPEGMLRAFANNVAGGQLEGASTLTQQYVKNVLIEAGRVSGDKEAIAQATETSVGRKLREARLAIGLEQKVSKDKILEGYLNIAQFGPSVYGVESASQHYFSKPAAELGIGESALLAGITQSPAKWDPVRNPEKAQERRDVVLGLMLDQGYITQAEHDEAVAVPIADMLHVKNAPNGCGAAGNAAYFCEYVVNDLLNNEGWGKDRADRTRMLYRGGLAIKTTLDPKKQQAAHDEITASVPVNDPSGVTMAMSSVEPGTGKILAMAQTTNWGTAATPEDPHATAVNLNVGLSHGGGLGFQSGSTFKVFTLIEWLKTGHSLDDKVSSTQRNFPRNTWNISCNPRLRDNYNNATNVEGVPTSPMMTVREATRLSINLSYIKMANQMDMCGIIGNAASMGLTRGDGSPLVPNPSAVLGTNTVTPLGMANAFATLAAGGTYCTPIAITEVTDRSGTEIPVPKSDCKKVLEPNVVNGVNSALQDVVSDKPFSTGRKAVLPGRPAAGKTGTANDDSHAWFVGYTPQLAAGIWMGHASGDVSMMNTTINGKFNKWVFGGSYPAETFQRYMTRALDGVPPQPFGAAPAQAGAKQTAVPDVTGRPVAEAQAVLSQNGFQVAVGTPVASQWPTGSVASTSPAAGAQAAPGSTVTIVPSSGPATAPAASGNTGAGNGRGNGGGDGKAPGNSGGNANSGKGSSGNGNGRGNGGGGGGGGGGPAPTTVPAPQGLFPDAFPSNPFPTFPATPGF